MIEYNKLILKKGSILTSEMLKHMHNDSRLFFDHQYSDFSDGIIKGFEVVNNSEKIIIITKGIFKYNGKLFLLNEDLDISEKILSLSEAKEYKIYLEKQDKVENNGIITESFEVSIEESTKSVEDICLLGEFIYRSGFLPKTRYKKMEDFKRKDDCISIINRKESNIGGCIISQKIIQFFAEKIISSKENIDIFFSITGMNSERILKKLLSFYLNESYRDFKQEDLNNNIKIYDFLNKILKVQSNSTSKGDNSAKENKNKPVNENALLN